jgi:dTDP-4-amino-4,6-dideoxygalactose transaminase
MIVFNKPYLSGNELQYIKEAASQGQLAGDGIFTEKCSNWIEHNTKCNTALITHSCTAALEMSAMLADIQPGDEIIMPSYTFVSSANAFVLRGGIPVFVDIEKRSLNIDADLIADAISPKTKAILVMHYAGVSCDMDKILEIAKNNNLIVIEDAAQGILSKYKNEYLGSIGDIGCYSFHETKNIISGEGGALLINNPSLVERAQIIRQKGTNRTKFNQGKTNKYSWVDIGSSYLSGELISAFLYAQLEKAEFITNERLKLWDTYHAAFSDLKDNEKFTIPSIPNFAGHNGHIFYLILKNKAERDIFINKMHQAHINCVFHYVPLHSSIGGRAYGRVCGDMINTEIFSERLVRLPLWINLDVDKVISSAVSILKSLS